MIDDDSIIVAERARKKYFRIYRAGRIEIENWFLLKIAENLKSKFEYLCDNAPCDLVLGRDFLSFSVSFCCKSIRADPNELVENAGNGFCKINLSLDPKNEFNSGPTKIKMIYSQVDDGEQEWGKYMCQTMCNIEVEDEKCKMVVIPRLGVQESYQIRTVVKINYFHKFREDSESSDFTDLISVYFGNTPYCAPRRISFSENRRLIK